MCGRSVTVTVPEALYDRLIRRAIERQRSFEEELVLALAATVPDGDGTPADFA